jgi:hypothetical protein
LSFEIVGSGMTETCEYLRSLNAVLVVYASIRFADALRSVS